MKCTSFAVLVASFMLASCSPPEKPTVKLGQAAREGKLDQVKAHIYYKSDLNEKGPKDFRPLHFAVVFLHGDIVKELISAGADVNAKDVDGNTPLHLSAASGELDVMKMLVEGKADVNAARKDGLLPFQMATVYRHKDCAEYLKSKGADTTIKPMKSVPRTSGV